MVGVDFDRAFAVLRVPQGYRVEAAVAVGRRGEASILPEPMRGREQPNGRMKLAEFTFEGGFPE